MLGDHGLPANHGLPSAGPGLPDCLECCAQLVLKAPEPCLDAVHRRVLRRLDQLAAPQAAVAEDAPGVCAVAFSLAERGCCASTELPSLLVLAGRGGGGWVWLRLTFRLRFE